MSIQHAQDIVKRLGPGRITLDRSHNGDLATELALIGCDVRDLSDGSTGGAALLDWSSTDDGQSTIALAASFDIIALNPGDHHRIAIDSALFAAGWRRHPAGMLPGKTPDWSDERLPQTSYYQRVMGALDHGPLRTTGAQADGFIARYAQTSHHVRSGDHVLVDGAFARDGIAILSALSRGGSFSDASRAPAGEIFRLDHLTDNSIDLIVAFQPPADNWQIALAEYARVLRLDGRIIMGWPRGADAMDESAPADWAALTTFADQLFVSESRYAQFEQGRALFPIDLDGQESEWMILVASADPLDGAARRAEYTNPGYPDRAGPVPVLIDFANAYDNPWLYRTMVQMGERLGDPIKLARLAECVLQDAQPGSVDRGAAIAVLGYRVLEMRMADAAPALLAQIADYLSATQGNDRPSHVVRWRVSLAFLAGRLCELIEDRAGALIWYAKAADDEWSAFSPILATKTIGACFFAGRLCLSARDIDGATAHFRRGVEIGQQVAAADHPAQMGATDNPLPFYFQELAEVIDMASQCANALFHMPLWDRDPGLYWRQVDVRRFGLASWALDLERENDRLRRSR